MTTEYIRLKIKVDIDRIVKVNGTGQDAMLNASMYAKCVIDELDYDDFQRQYDVATPAEIEEAGIDDNLTNLTADGDDE